MKRQVSLSAFGGSLIAVLSHAAVSAQTALDDVKSGADSLNTGGAGKNADGILASAINIFGLVVGIIAVIMIIFGGLRYIMSGGDSNKVSSAKNTLLYAIIGLAIAASAQVLVKFVLTKV